MIDKSLPKLKINLLQPELLPKKKLVTLNKMMFSLLLVLCLMVLWAVITGQKEKSLAKQVDMLSAENDRQSEHLEELKEKLTQRRTDPALTAKLDTLKLVMRNKQALHAKLTDPNKTFVAGYANSMSELARYHHSGISLQEVFIQQDEMIFSGLAKSPEAVPQWLSGFQDSVLLSGKQFKNFKLQENENKVTAFTIGSTFLNEKQAGAE